MKAFQLVLFLILLGTRMQTVKRQEMDRILEKVSVPGADSSNRCRRMKLREREWKERRDWREENGRNSQGKDARTLKRTVRVGTLEPQKRNSQGKDPRICEGRSHQVQKWRVQEKRKVEKWKNEEKAKGGEV